MQKALIQGGRLLFIELTSIIRLEEMEMLESELERRRSARNWGFVVAVVFMAVFVLGASLFASSNIPTWTKILFAGACGFYTLIGCGCIIWGSRNPKK